MKWILFTGTWRTVSKEIEQDVRTYAREVFERGDGMVTGGATGVDFFAINEWLKLNKACSKIKIFIPAELEYYLNDYRKNWNHAPITHKEIDALAQVLHQIKSCNADAIIEGDTIDGDITQEDFNNRHNREVEYSHEVYAFQVNKSSGTQDTIDKAKEAGLPITVHKEYTC